MTQAGQRPLEPLRAAKMLCRARDWKLSNLEIQKILYIGQVVMLGDKDRHMRFVDADFEAWHYGPVIRELYHALKVCGAGNIQENAPCWSEVPSTDADEEWRSFTNGLATGLSGMTPGILVGATHTRGSAWRNHYNPNEQRVLIPDSDIANDYGVVLPALFW